MANQTKMIIITSDEDIIRRFSLNKNTQIIDLDNNTLMNSAAKDINLDFLAQLSELNANNDQVYKRALDSSNDSRSKPVKTQKKSIDIICAICGDRAIGFNYDVLSCGSCKVFFRRNAHLDLETIPCLTGQGQCSVSHDIRRKCQRCRLNRCFTMGMRKDYIMSQEEKQRRKQSLEQNRNKTTSTSTSNVLSNLHTTEQIDQTSMDIHDDIIVSHESINSNEIEDTLFDTLSVEDWLTIESVRSLFLSIFENDNEQCACVDTSNRITALITWSQFINRVALRFINFFRRIHEFEDLHLDDRFILIKYNIFPLFLILKCFYYKPTNDCCSNDDNEVAEKHRRFYMLCGDSYGIRDEFVNFIRSSVKLTEQDPTLLSLLSMILIFSQGLSMDENQPSLKDSLAVNRSQFYYTKVLWNYLINKWGEIQACKHFIQLLTMIFRIQSLAKKAQDFFRVQYITSDTVDQISPIIQSVLHIS